MDFNLAEEQEMLKTMARDFLADKCPKTLVKQLQEDETGHSAALWSEMAGLGWTGLVLPEKYGGTAMTFLDLTVLLEEMGRAAMPGPFISTVVLGALPILEWGTDQQKDFYLRGVSDGSTILTSAITEPSASYEASSFNVKASAVADGYEISGTKLFVPDAHIANYMLCVARTDDTVLAEEGLTVFLVDAKSSGIKTTVLKTVACDKLCEVVFDNVKIPQENIIGKLNGGWEIIQRNLQQASVAKCAQLLGGIQRMLEMTVAYAQERSQYERHIGSFQVIQHYCAIMATDVDGAKFSTYQAAWLMSNGMPAGEAVSIAKMWANEAFGRVSTYAHQIHGAIGVTIDHELQFYTRQGAAAALSFGGGDYHREIIAREMGL